MFYWDPKPEIFTIPYLHFPILWYGVLFTAGFFIGFFIFVRILRRFFLHDPEYRESDIYCLKKLSSWGKSVPSVVKALNDEIQKSELKTLPRKIEKFVQKSNPLNLRKAIARLYLDLKLKPSVLGIYQKATRIADQIVLYMLLATIIGARLGHFLFYERPMDYLQNPLQIFRVWEGGLASHGAAIAIVFALLLFSYRIRKIARGLSWIRLLDFVCIPTALCGCFIRVGNFFNQEILGKPTTLPWGVMFGNPSGGPRGVALHPVQLMEALFYLLTLFLLLHLSRFPKNLLKEGRLIGLFLILVFGFRFFIEFFKLEQSQLFSATSFLNMGQLLSIPMILLGVFLLVRSFLKKAMI